MRSSVRSAAVTVASAGGGAEDRDDDPHFFGGGIAVLDPDRGNVWARRVTHSGIFPCFFGGKLSRLVLSARSARVTFIRVLLGVITVSM